MIAQGGRIATLWPQLRLQNPGSYSGLSSNTTARVVAVYHALQKQQLPQRANRKSIILPIICRTYADSRRPVSRPKAHTGRTTTSAKRAPTTSKTKAAKKPATKTKAPKARPSAKSEAKPKTRSKPKSGRKKAKAKATPRRKTRSKKIQTPEQKRAAENKLLKSKILKPPGGAPATAWTVLFQESFTAHRAGEGTQREQLSRTSKAISKEYKELSPERLEHYNHIANQNAAANAVAYRKWIESHTPLEVYEANNARRRLKTRGVKGNLSPLHDDRQVKSSRNSYSFFYEDRYASGDFKGLKPSEAARLVGREWKGLSASEKKPYENKAAEDMVRYTQEKKTVLNKEVEHKKAKTPAAAWYSP